MHLHLLKAVTNQHDRKWAMNNLRASDNASLWDTEWYSLSPPVSCIIQIRWISCLILDESTTVLCCNPLLELLHFLHIPTSCHFHKLQNDYWQCQTIICLSTHIITITAIYLHLSNYTLLKHLSQQSIIKYHPFTNNYYITRPTSVSTCQTQSTMSIIHFSWLDYSLTANINSSNMLSKFWCLALQKATNAINVWLKHTLIAQDKLHGTNQNVHGSQQ